MVIYTKSRETFILKSPLLSPSYVWGCYCHPDRRGLLSGDFGTNHNKEELNTLTWDPQ